MDAKAFWKQEGKRVSNHPLQKKELIELVKATKQYQRFEDMIMVAKMAMARTKDQDFTFSDSQVLISAVAFELKCRSKFSCYLKDLSRKYDVDTDRLYKSVLDNADQEVVSQSREYMAILFHEWLWFVAEEGAESERLLRKEIQCEIGACHGYVLKHGTLRDMSSAKSDARKFFTMAKEGLTDFSDLGRQIKILKTIFEYESEFGFDDESQITYNMINDALVKMNKVPYEPLKNNPEKPPRSHVMGDAGWRRQYARINYFDLVTYNKEHQRFNEMMKYANLAAADIMFTNLDDAKKDVLIEAFSFDLQHLSQFYGRLGDLSQTKKRSTHLMNSFLGLVQAQVVERSGNYITKLQSWLDSVKGGERTRSSMILEWVLECELGACHGHLFKVGHVPESSEKAAKTIFNNLKSMPVDLNDRDAKLKILEKVMEYELFFGFNVDVSRG